MAHKDFDFEGEESAALAVPASAPNLEAPAPVLPSKLPSSAASVREYPAFDPVLDEDLFHFDEGTARSESKASGEYVSRTEILSTAHSEVAPVEETGIPAAQASEQPSEHEEIERVTRRDSSQATVVPSSFALATLGGFLASRWGLVALATTSIVQAALVFFAWRASDAFRDAVRGAREELVQGHPVEPASTSPSNIEPARGPEVVTTSAPDPHDIDEWVAGLDSPTEITFRIAEREIEEGEYTAARRRLYALLAVQDDGVITADRIADARYWIAEAWARESTSIVDSKEEQ